MAAASIRSGDCQHPLTRCTISARSWDIIYIHAYIYIRMYIYIYIYIYIYCICSYNMDIQILGHDDLKL